MHELSIEGFVRSVDAVGASRVIADKIKPFCLSVSTERHSTSFVFPNGKAVMKHEKNGISIFISANGVVEFYGIRSIICCYLLLLIKENSIYWFPSRKNI
ncbi:hypothetical protein F9K85_15200 [Brucella tritici]|nr:hypothetical protein F9K85_15200 [Brucella tritici]